MTEKNTLAFTIFVFCIHGHFLLPKKLQKYDILSLLHKIKSVIETLIAFIFLEKIKPVYECNW